MNKNILGLLLALTTTTIVAQEASFPDKVEVFQKAISSHIVLTGDTYGTHEILGYSLSRDLAEHPNPGTGVEFHAVCENSYSEVKGRIQSSCQLDIQRVWNRGNISLTTYNITLTKVGNEDVIVAASRSVKDF